MEKVLVGFINTLDLSLKKLLTEANSISGVSQLTVSQLQYIDAIHELNKPTITKIAHQLNIAKASVSTGINKLIDKGFVIKTQSEHDKRIFYLSLTETGKKLIDVRYQALKEYVEFINTALSQEETEHFEAILIKLVDLFALKD